MIKFKQSKKDILKWIKNEASKLPEKMYLAFPKYSKPKVVNKGTEEKPEYEIHTAEPSEYKVNHKRRAWRAYKTNGLQGLTNYFQMNGFELQTKN